MLEYAARTGNIEVVKFARSHNASLFQENEKNLTLSEIAYNQGHVMLAESTYYAVVSGAYVSFPSEQPMRITIIQSLILIMVKTNLAFRLEDAFSEKN